MVKVGVYVDDVVIVVHTVDAHLEWFESKFTGPDRVSAKHVGQLSWFPGVEVMLTSRLLYPNPNMLPNYLKGSCLLARLV